jgi:hypothetical protein
VRIIRCLHRAPLALTLTFVATVAAAADVTPPAEVGGLLVNKSGPDVQLSWSAVTTDALGNAETTSSYRVYRSTAASFVPDKTGGANRIGSSPTTAYTDAGAAADGNSYYYLVSAVDAAGNEGPTKPSTITSVPTLSGTYTDTGISLSWTAAAPAAQVAKYRVYYGNAPRTYAFSQDAGLALSTTLNGLASNVVWYCAVVAVDVNGNESAYSNEIAEVVAGRYSMTAHNDDDLCWLSGGATCPPRAGTVQRNDGFQLMVPVDFPPGNWTKITVTFTLDSRLCKVGQDGTTDKCGGTNTGGYNPCGDPWDRTAHLFLVLDGCIGIDGANCITPDNLELMRAITPFGTDAPAPLGDAKVPPRVLTLDVTPFAPLLAGHKYVGADIGNFVQAGWHVTSQFSFSKRPEEASAKKPAAGIQVVGFGDAPLAVRSVAIPAGATKVIGRLFTTGHGGTQYCDGGSKDGVACTSNTNCPGGTCQNCDEFCHRTNRILKNGAPVYTVVPFRTDCSPGGPFDCQSWNACGWPSCTGSRAGWCPGYIACTSTGACDQDIDLTSSFPAGGTYDVSYDVLVQRGEWAVSLVMYWYFP